MLLRSTNSYRRPASALIETAVIVSVFMMLLFGVVEYCRFLYVNQLIDNAAREGARFAVVNTSDATLVADTQAIVLSKMGGQNNQMQNFTVSVYAASSNTSNLGANIGAANTAQFGQYICVQVTCNYVPITPSLLRMGNTVPINVKILMCSEAN